MQPIIEVRNEKRPGRLNTMRTFLICRHPVGGGLISRKMLGSTLSREDIAVRALEFTAKWLAIFDINFGTPSLVSRCESVLL